MLVPVSNRGASFATQLVGIVAIGAFTFLVSLAPWAVIRSTVGRIAEEDEDTGIDQVEIVMEAYPEFGPGVAKRAV